MIKMINVQQIVLRLKENFIGYKYVRYWKDNRESFLKRIARQKMKYWRFYGGYQKKMLNQIRDSFTLHIGTCKYHTVYDSAAPILARFLRKYK